MLLSKREFVPAVAGKIFVAAISGENHRHMLARHLRDVVGRDGRRVGKRLVIVPCQLRNKVDSTRPDDVLDALRGFAALWVFLYHIWNIIYPYQSTQMEIAQLTGQESWNFYLTFFLVQYGYLGVTIFFVISGFCIHLPQARRFAQTGADELRLGYFFRRRFWRLYPAYFAALWVASRRDRL